VTKLLLFQAWTLVSGSISITQAQSPHHNMQSIPITLGVNTQGEQSRGLFYLFQDIYSFVGVMFVIL